MKVAIGVLQLARQGDMWLGLQDKPQWHYNMVLNDVELGLVLSQGFGLDAVGFLNQWLLIPEWH
jgi:hypothetical protein